MRHTQISGLAAAAVVFLFIGAAPAIAAPHTDAEIQSAIDDYRAKWTELFSGERPEPEQIDALRAGALDGIDVSALTPKQISWLHNANMITSDEQRTAAIERLTTFEDADGVDGACAAVTLLALKGGVTDPNNRPDPELQLQLLRDVLHHTALPEAMHSGAANGLFDAIRSLAKRSVWKDARDELVALDTLIDERVPAELALGFEDYFTVLRHAFEDEGEARHETVQRIRAHLVAVGKKKLNEVKGKTADLTERETQWLADAVARLDSPHAKGTFIGSQAPKLDFIWSSSDTYASWSDLEGKVVVLDFWATWCGPCVASFPNMRELVNRYEGYDVAIIGVTSPQGMVVMDDGVEECDDVEQELSLMPAYIKSKDITWPIAFSEQEVFNTDYGVRGIPHVTIIAPDGSVRHNNLHPADPLPEKAAKIDALLEEFDLPAPAPLSGATESDTDGDE